MQLFHAVRAIATGKRITAHAQAVKDEVRRTFDSEVGPDVLREFADIVSDWRHRPRFESQVRVTPARITVTVFPARTYGAGARASAEQIFAYVDQGTRPHMIVPRHAKRLHFFTGYQPKTLPIARAHVGPGAAAGDEVFAMEVHHPGTKARQFSREIARKYQSRFDAAIQRAVARALARR